MRRMITDKLTKNIKEIVAAYQAGEIGAKVEVANITAIDGAILTDLKAGDIVVKKTGDMRHTYVVTYKEENKGICMTYVDASVAETVSYDYVTNAWVYNSTDVTPLGGTQVVANPTLVGDEANLTGLQVGDTKYAVPQGGGGGSQLYQHNIKISANIGSGFNTPSCRCSVTIMSSSNALINTEALLASYLQTNGFTGDADYSATYALPASGVYMEGIPYIIYGLVVSDGEIFALSGGDSNGSLDLDAKSLQSFTGREVTITDKVITL